MAMSEVEFDRLLDAVKMAVAAVPREDALAYPLPQHQSPQAANDNAQAWPLFPFPDGWNGTC